MPQGLSNTMKVRHRSGGSPALPLRLAPTGRIRSETEPGDTARKDSMTDSDLSMSRPSENAAESKIINGLVGRIVSKLPCNSGVRLFIVVADPNLNVAIQSLRKFAIVRFPTVINSLVVALETLAKHLASRAPMDVPLEVYQSQAILLHILDTCLTGYWQHQMNDQTAPHQTDVPRLWPDPPALDDYTARSLLNVVTVYLRALSAEADTSAGTASTAPNKDDRGQSASTIPWGHGSTQQSRAVSLSREFLQAHSFGTWVQPTRHVALFDVASLTSMAESLSHTTRYIGHIIFYLSSSNWPLVLARIKFRLSYLTTTIEDTPDLIELRLLQWSNLDRARLGQVMQEASKIFLHIKRPSQLAFASVIHSAIWNWVNFNSGEFDTLVSSEQRMEGDPEVLFDALYGMSDFSSSHAKRTAVFYPLLAMILVICPDMLKEVVGGKAANKSSGLSKKYSFMESLKKGLSSGKGFEPSAACYVDFLKAAVRLSPRHGGAALRILLPELIHDLQDSLFFGSHSKVLVESGLPVEGLVALYSADPVHIGSTVFNRLWLDSDISRAIAIQACAWTVAEGDFLPWRPTITSFRSEFAGSVRQVFRAGVATYTAGDNPSLISVRQSIEASPAVLDVLVETLKLYVNDPRFAVASSAGQEDGWEITEEIVPLISTLLRNSGAAHIKEHAQLALFTVLRSRCSSLGTAVDTIVQPGQSSRAIWLAMSDSALWVHSAFVQGDTEEGVLAIGNLSRIIPLIARQAQSLRGRWQKGMVARIACHGAAMAVLIALTISPLEQQSSVASALSDLAASVRVVFRDDHVAPGSTSTNLEDHGNPLAALLDQVSGLPHATGRQQQHRQIRRVLRDQDRSSVIMTLLWATMSVRLKSLMAKMGRFSPEKILGDMGAEAMDNSGLSDEEGREWQNLISFLAATADRGIPVDATTLKELFGTGLHPRVIETAMHVTTSTSDFINNTVHMLISGSIFVRESAKDALGNELPLTLSQTLVSSMMNLLLHCVGTNGLKVSDTFTVLLEQSIAVLRLTVDRVQPGSHLDVSEIMLYFARYLSRLGRDDAALRLKMRYCHLAEMVMSKEETVSAGHDSIHKNSLLDWLTEWSLDSMKDVDAYSSSHITRSKTQKDLDHACLRTLAVATKGLVLRSTTEPSEETPIGVRARLFQKYFTMLIRALERAAAPDEGSVRRRTTTADSSAGTLAPETPSSLAIIVLSNLLSANMDVGLKHCLTLGYHENPLLRSAFLQLTSSILRTATPFGGLDSQLAQSNLPRPYLDALMADNLAFAVAICEVCPAPEADEMLALLFRSMEAKGTLMNLVKVMIEKEVAQTNHESELFRANSIATKMLTIFGKTFGYNYVRSTLNPLIHNMVEKPAACSFELDPSKAGPGEDIEKNADHLRLMCQALLDLICTTTNRVPVMFRALCQQIWEIVEDRFPEARHSAIGSFIFLRFFCPAIVTPEAVDLDVPSESREIRRALLLITKVIQNLANNVKFKEPHMQILNTFLAENIKQVTRFLSDIAMRPRSGELAQAVKQYADETEKLQDRDVDNDILHRFVWKHFSKLQPVLENMPPSYRRSITPRSARADIDGAAALKVIVDVMRSAGHPVEMTALDPSAKASAYDEVMRRNAGRDTSSVQDVFCEGPLSQNGRRIFYFVFSAMNAINYDLLSYHIYSTMQEVTETFDLVFDFTGYSPAVDFPNPWIQRIVQLCPDNLLQMVNVLALYNVNTYATTRVKRIVGALAPICGPVGRSVITACSPSELGETIPFTNLNLPDFTMNLAFEADHVFTNLLKVSNHEAQMPVVVKLGITCLQIASWSKHAVTATLKAYVVDTIKLHEIDDLVTGSGETEDHLTVTYRQTYSVTFVSKKRNEMAHLIRTARSRLRDTPNEERALRPRDVPVTLLNIALLNLSASDEILRTGAYNLFNDLGKFYDYDLFQGVRKVTAGMTLPANSSVFIHDLSQTLAQNAPYLTLEFLKEWTIGFGRADIAQKTACLQYVSPWISNLETFASPSRDDAEQSIKQVAEIIRSLISITSTERKRLQLVVQAHIWDRIVNKSEHLTDIVVAELVDAAISGGMGSERAESVAETLHAISTNAIRGHLIARLRKTIAQTYLKPSATLDENPAWNEICVLARINLMLSFTPANALGTQLYLPESIHIITLLAGVGSTLVRQTIYGIFINMLQAMASSKAADDMNGTKLQQALSEAQTPPIMSCFGLYQSGSGLESLEEGLSKEETENVRLDRIETLAGFMANEVLDAAAPNTDCQNSWGARWMSLVVGTCFQHNPATQPQAFIILGVLAIDEVDDDLIYQILVSLSTTLSHLSETDTTLLISMLRCLQALYAGLSSSRQYETSLFWLGFAVAEMGYIPLLGTALGLMYTALIHVKPEDHAGRCIENLLNFRRAMGDAAVKVDHMAGIRFDPEPSYGLVAILSKALRHPSTRGMAISLGLELLDMTTRESEHLGKDETALIPKDSVAYFVALLPVLSGNLEDRKRLFTKAGLLASEDPLRDLSSLSVLSLLSIPDNTSAIFVISIVVTTLNSSPSDSERLVLYRLLADASFEMPEVLSMAYDILIPLLSTTINTSSHPALIEYATVIIGRALSDTNYTFPTNSLSASDSQISLQQSFKGSISSLNGGGGGGPLVAVLEDLGMKALGEGGFAPVKMDRLAMTAKWVAASIDSLTLYNMD